ncbi:Transmembrane protein 209 [Cryptotermes secundus]|uniref:Transmembrane protein 209 n=2 Tax=Cryptotermes secundus TaxID=105785 RepID=A0A2J7RH81_9NEOP|nr:transmembrane protein 209 isoform X1 [Cryptotermes secundus]PNF40193.1 Transmembrane protein 209 [Cryptotermes secundus]
MRSGRDQTSVMDQALQVTQEMHKTKNSLLWGIINGILMAIVLYDVIYTCPMYTATVIYFEWLVALVLMLNTAYHFGHYLRRTFYLDPVTLSPTQKKLLGISDSDPHFKITSPPADMSRSSTLPHSDILSSTPINLSASSWRSSSFMSSPSDSMMSANYTMSSPSWVYHQGSPVATLSIPRNRSQQTSPGSQLSAISSVDFIENERSLTQYLQDYENFERTAAVGQSVEQPSNLLSSFWSHPATRTASEVPPTLRRCSYQLAPPTTVPTVGSPGSQADETGSPSSSLYQSQDVWRRVRVNPNVLTQWNANLRMWISKTILFRLVKEIEAVDEALQRHGLADIRVGSVGLERLKKTAQILQVSQNIPTLISLIPFLELTSNQEYLVTRIKELAKGGCMSEFRWNSGGSLHNKDWEEHLPTDSAVVMHLFATYLDSQLPPLPQNPDGRPFTSSYFAKTPDKPPQGKNTFAIYQVQMNPPHYVLLDGEDTLEVAKGRNNLFHTLLLFLHLVNTKEHGMLGRVNLGPSGVNLLWVIET